MPDRRYATTELRAAIEALRVELAAQRQRVVALETEELAAFRQRVEQVWERAVVLLDGDGASPDELEARDDAIHTLIERDFDETDHRAALHVATDLASIEARVARLEAVVVGYLGSAGGREVHPGDS
jgi:hypothetical protein